MLAPIRGLRQGALQFQLTMTGTLFDLVDSASDFGTIAIESEQEFVFGELIDNEPVVPTVLSDSANQ